MDIKLIETEKRFSEEEVNELERFLSRLPYPHLQSLESIERAESLGDALGDSSPWGGGGIIRLSDKFYNSPAKKREWVFLHELGHNYYDFIDETEGNRSIVRWGPCKKEDVSRLLRVQWMDLGRWYLDPENWEKVKAIDPRAYANTDKYMYITIHKDPNCGLGEWVCPAETRIPKDPLQFGFRYDEPFYSPKEEMADAYALFVLGRSHFMKSANADDAILAKYEFTQNQFIGNSSGLVSLRR